MNHLNHARRLTADENGSVSIEFVIWVPLLMFWLVVSVSAYSAFNARSAAASAAFTVADAMSRQIEVDDPFMNDLATLHANLLPGTDNRVLRVSSILFVEGNPGGGGGPPVPDQYRVLWSSALGDDSPLTDNRIPVERMPTMADADTVILIESVVPYRFFTDWLGQDFTVWRHTLAIRPRFAPAVAKIDSVPPVVALSG